MNKFGEPNHKAKCRARKIPAIAKNSQSFLDSFLNSSLFSHTIGSNKAQARYMRYMLIILAGASDHFTNMAAKEMAIIEIVSNNPTGVFMFPPERKNV